MTLLLWDMLVFQHISMLKLSYDMVAVNQQWFRRSPSGFFAYGDYSNFFRNDYTFLREMTPGIYFPDLRTTTLQ